MQCVPTGTGDKVAGAATATATTIVIDEIGNQVDITASASTSSDHLLWMMVMILIAAAATTAVVTFPFIEREMRLGLVESILQLGDASPTFTTASFDDHNGLLMMMVVACCCCLWRWDLWLFLLWLLLLLMILVVAAIAVLKVFLPDVVLVEIEFVFFVVVVVVLVRGYVPILRVAAVLGTDRPCGRFVVELGAALLLLIGRRVRDQLRRTELDGIRGATQ